MLFAIKEQRAAAVAEMRSIVTTAEAAKRSLNADESAKFDTLKTKITELESAEARASFLADAERRAIGQPVDKSRANLESNVSIVEVLRAQMEGRALTGAAAEYSVECERRNGRKATGIYVPLSALEQRATNTTGTAGQIVPTDHRADQYIEPFRNALLARKLGVRVLSGLSGNVSIPKYASGMSSGWVAEDAALTSSGMTFDSVTLSPKHCGGMAEMSRQLLQQSSPDIEQLVRNDLSYLLAQAIDTALIKGGGTNQPTGVLATTGIQTGNLATMSWANVLKMLEALEISNAAAANWLTAPKVKTKLAKTLKEAGLPGYLLESGNVAGLPLFSTNQVPEKTGTPNTGIAILGDWSQVMLGIWSEIDLLVNPFSETAYSKGNVLVRAMSTVDIAIRHPEAFVVAQDISLA
jgi:HK97 family phage major capsid protein